MSEVQKSRVFVPGKPNKGRILEAIRRHIIGWIYYKFEYNQYMNQENWVEGEFDGVPGYWITVEHTRTEGEVQPVVASEFVALKDTTGAIKVIPAPKEEKSDG